MRFDFLAPFRGYLYAACGLAFVLLTAWALRLDHLRGEWKSDFETLTRQAGAVLAATRIASDNPKLTWELAPGQITALGAAKKQLTIEIAEQNRAVDQMARDAVRMRAEAAELKHIADRAEAQRREALRRLSDMTLVPGSRDVCLDLLREAEEALDIVYEEGL